MQHDHVLVIKVVTPRYYSLQHSVTCCKTLRDVNLFLPCYHEAVSRGRMKWILNCQIYVFFFTHKQIKVQSGFKHLVYSCCYMTGENPVS